MSAYARAIRGWLMQQPRPAMLRLTTGDGEPQELRLGRSFAKTAETIDALSPTLIEALDGEGKLLRATSLKEAEVEHARAAVPAALATDPETARLTHFANLLAEAYRHSTDVAFTKLVEVVERIGDRADSIEQRLERTEAAYRRSVREQIDAAFERAEEIAEKAGEGEGTMLEQMGAAFLSSMGGGMGGAAAKPKPNGSANGKGSA